LFRRIAVAPVLPPLENHELDVGLGAESESAPDEKEAEIKFAPS